MDRAASDLIDLPEREAAEEYVKEHKLQELFVNATAAMMNEQPENPKKFLVEFLKSVKQARDSASAECCPNVFTEQNILSMYKTMDVTERGYITVRQYNAAMSNLGISQFNTQPVGYNKDAIKRDIFVTEAKSGLVSASATYAAYNA